MNRDELLAVPDLVVEIVQVPEWKCELRVRGLTGTERDQFEQSSYVRKGKSYDLNLKNVRARLVRLCVVDDNNQPIFQEGDESALGNKNAAALNRLFEVAQRLSGLTKSDVEDLAKNSDGGPSVSSTSA